MSRFALVLALGFGSFAFGCSKAATDVGNGTEGGRPAVMNTEVVTLAVEGMTCSGCEDTVRDQLAAVPGVVRIESVDHETKRAVVLVKPGTDKNALCAAVTDGYHATLAPAPEH